MMPMMTWSCETCDSFEPVMFQCEKPPLASVSLAGGAVWKVVEALGDVTWEEKVDRWG